MNASTDLEYLLTRQLEGSLSLSEKRGLFLLLNDPGNREQYQVLVQAAIQRASEDGQKETTRDIREMIDYVLQYEKSIPSAKPVHRVHFLKTAWIRYAAAVVVLFGIGAYLWSTQQDNDAQISQTKAISPKNDVAPGSNRAILTLSDGRTVELTPETGTIAEAGTNIQNQNGKLAYGKADKVVFNTMSTPRGGQYQLTLPDGTNVWLNAASSITYPTAFTANTREVTMTGEAYFEVANDKSKPFHVKTVNEKISVLGTRFNVNAYADEPAMKTSLMEGAVKVGQAVLRPGQAYVNGVVVKTNMQQDLAWKNGLFYFDNADLKTILRQFERWYDMEVVYEGPVSNEKFFSMMSRNAPLTTVLKSLQANDVRFRVQGKKLFIQ
jgi:transmembrane sensor